MSRFLKGYESVANARITAGLVLKIKVAEFENLKEVLKTEFPEAEIIYQRTGTGKLWIKEDTGGEQTNGKVQSKDFED